MFHYELYCDDGREFLVADAAIENFDEKVVATLREMPLARLKGRGEDWFLAVVDEFCQRHGCRQVKGPAVDVEELRDQVLLDRDG